MVVAQSLERLLAVLHDVDPVAALGEQELQQVLRSARFTTSPTCSSSSGLLIDCRGRDGGSSQAGLGIEREQADDLGMGDAQFGEKG